jgi:hypothetical protein
MLLTKYMKVVHALQPGLVHCSDGLAQQLVDVDFVFLVGVPGTIAGRELMAALRYGEQCTVGSFWEHWPTALADRK